MNATAPETVPAPTNAAGDGPLPVVPPEGKTYAFVSLGCPKNLVDSERMLGLLAANGYVPVSDPHGADMVVINTCGFVESARAESTAVIKEMTALKQRGQVGKVIVTGCLAERMGPQLIADIPEVDQAIGVFAREDIVQIADRAFQAAPDAKRLTASTEALALEQRTLFRPAAVKALDDTARLRVTPRHFSYLKISEGCDRKCTFCAIPGMRGTHVTKPIEQVIAEARELASDGVRELNIVSQDTTYYGIDYYGRSRLADLIGELDKVDGLEWIRFLYAYPEHLDDAVIDAWAGARRVVPYLDMPLQHINDRTLRRMNRRHSRQQTVDLIGRLRERWPGLALRTTFIVGFPGETDEEFDELCAFVRQARFERLGVFPYSWEDGTPATKLDGHLPDDVKQTRRDQLMAIQQEVAFAQAEAKVGKELPVIVDAIDPKRPNLRLARTTADAPEIDTQIYIKVKGEAASAKPGDFLLAHVIGTRHYDLLSEASAKPW